MTKDNGCLRYLWSSIENGINVFEYTAGYCENYLYGIQNLIKA